ncbi:MAG TPA: protein kinase [Kofleriaceae bacterium]
MDQPLQKSLERYDVLDRIAVGGMAEVFLAKAYGAHGFEKTLAIKRILPELASDPEFAARFIAEAKVAVRLSHANIVQVFDFGRIGESLFIAMEYVDGLDLAAMLRKFKDEDRQVPLPAAFHIAIEIIRALDFAHGHNVVHRDVSPSNILISRAGEVKIADFGIAIAAQPHRSSGTGPRRVMGKWRYMSPELARGDTLDTRSDLFSAASVIFELFTGEKLFPGDEAEEITKNIHEMPIPKMSSVRPNLPSRLDEVLGGALARKPIDRPSRPATVLRSLIELSYESSIMATALDVAEALATVIPAKRVSGRGAIDDVIRKQLHAEKSVARRTAITDGKPSTTESAEPEGGSTGLFRKVDTDGLARLEEVELEGAMADGTATRVIGPPRVVMESENYNPGDSGIGKLYEASLDPDRHTEPGGPPTGAVPKNIDLGASSSMVAMSAKGKPIIKKAPQTKPKSRWGLFLAFFILLAGAGAAGTWWFVLRDRGSENPVVDPSPDGSGLESQNGAITIDPSPEGVTGWLEIVGKPETRVAIPALAKGQPFQHEVPADTKVHVHLELVGFKDHDEEVTVGRERLKLTTRMVPAPARLHIETDPPGAQVSLAGRALVGDTPITYDDLDPGENLALVISKLGYAPVQKTITLEAGKTFDVTEVLKPAEKFGFITITVKGAATWGEVSSGGTMLGLNANATGLKQFKLPIGKRKLTIKNPPANKSKTITVNITEKPQSITVVLD